MTLAWLFGLLRKDITSKERVTENKEKVLQEKRKLGRKRSRAIVILEILRIRGLLRRIKILMNDILILPRIKDFKADLTVGLGDPADTGLLFALIGPAISFLSPFLHNKIKVQPSFVDNAILEGSLYGTLRLRPILTITPLLKFIFSLPALRVAKILVVTRWKGNK
jgi:hypothetical protein